MMDKTCKTCGIWMNKQRQLNYLEDWGICEADLQHDWDAPKAVKIICQDDPYSHVTESHIDTDGSFKAHKILICTNESFGCVRWKEEEK